MCEVNFYRKVCSESYCNWLRLLTELKKDEVKTNIVKYAMYNDERKEECWRWIGAEITVRLLLAKQGLQEVSDYMLLQDRRG